MSKSSIRAKVAPFLSSQALRLRQGPLQGLVQEHATGGDAAGAGQLGKGRAHLAVTEEQCAQIRVDGDFNSHYKEISNMAERHQALSWFTVSCSERSLGLAHSPPSSPPSPLCNDISAMLLCNMADISIKQGGWAGLNLSRRGREGRVLPPLPLMGEGWGEGDPLPR